MIKTILRTLAICCIFFIGVHSTDASRGFKITSIEDLSHRSGKLGDFKALVIGINDYADPEIPDLTTAVNDADNMARVLAEKYGFKVELLFDRQATREGIYKKLRELAASTGPNDSVLIYFAGHGDLDRTYDDGWWIPADAVGGNPVTYLRNYEVQIAMRSMKARHVLLISDSCYSGTLFGKSRALPPVIGEKYYLGLYNEKSRWGMTSGNKEPVSDAGSEGHSVFAYQLLKELNQNAKPFISVQEIYTRIAPIISNNSEQTPLCRPIRNTGDQGGEFVFVAALKDESTPAVTKPKKGNLELDLAFWQSIQGSDDPALFQAYLQQFPNGTFVPIAKRKIEILKPKKEVASISAEDIKPKAAAEILKAKLFVSTEPENARVRILNIKPKFQQGIELKPGSYHIEVAARGHEIKKQWIKLDADEERRISIGLAKKPETGTINVSGSPHGAKVYLEGKFKGEMPVVLKNVNQDSHRMEVSADGYETRVLQVTLGAGEDKNVVVRLERSRFTNSLGMEFVAIPAGSFMMGSPSSEKGRDSDEKQHKVTLTRGFYLQTTEVTQDQWKAVMGNNPSYFKSCGDDCPVEQVSWDDAQEFIRKLNRKEGTDRYRLPTEAEWEYAARAGSATAFANGDITEIECGRDPNLDAIGWYCGNSGKSIHPVASKKENVWGLYDMHGNVWEWCQDWYGDYPSGSVTNPRGPSSSSRRVVRGGSWDYYAGGCRSANRVSDHPDVRDSLLGFRLARTL